ncbi:MAG TPA: gamma-glutamyl-gamma-aminobutyrate hydrolase family protein [Pseudomonadales bacterium]|nr:gamma-glutamyl-gamma-aminobutyrate hydrolase family protein [Pseudomonadales bacterium]
MPIAWWASRAALSWVGARPVHLRPGDRLPAALAGLVVGGGADIGAGLYDPLAEDVEASDPERDAFEIDALGQAFDRGLPVLGICRGAQLMNVVRGGSLVRDVRDQRILGSNRSTLLPTRPVRLEPGSLLSRVLLREGCRVNALHRQAVLRTGTGLAVVARDIDGIPQAIEDDDQDFRIGVQWHPEYLAWQAVQRRLFAALTRVAGHGRASS